MPEVVDDLCARLCSILDPDRTDQEARTAQNALVEQYGGRDAVIARGAFDNSPVPGEEPEFHVMGADTD